MSKFFDPSGGQVALLTAKGLQIPATTYREGSDGPCRSKVWVRLRAPTAAGAPESGKGRRVTLGGRE